MAEPTKEYRVRVWVKLTDELLPGPVLSKEELRDQLQALLDVGGSDLDIDELAYQKERAQV